MFSSLKKDLRFKIVKSCLQFALYSLIHNFWSKIPIWACHVLRGEFWQKMRIQVFVSKSHWKIMRCQITAVEFTWRWKINNPNVIPGIARVLLCMHPASVRRLFIILIPWGPEQTLEINSKVWCSVSAWRLSASTRAVRRRCLSWSSVSRCNLVASRHVSTEFSWVDQMLLELPGRRSVVFAAVIS